MFAVKLEGAVTGMEQLGDSLEHSNRDGSSVAKPAGSGPNYVVF
jgi:hypothetical protein